MMKTVIAVLAVATMAAAQRAEMLTRDGHVVTEAQGFKMTDMSGAVVLDLSDAGLEVEAESVALSAADKLTISADNFAIQGEDASVSATPSSITMVGANFTANSGTSASLTAVTNVDIDASTTNLKSDSMSLAGSTVNMDVQGDVTVAASTTFSVVNSDDTAKATMDASKIMVTTPKLTASASTSATVAGSSVDFQAGGKDTMLSTGASGLSLTADNIVLVGKDGSVDFDALYEDLESLITEAESLEVDLESTDSALTTRAQGQEDQVSAMVSQRAALSADVSTEASAAGAELLDLNSEISTFDSTLEGSIASNEVSADARSDTNAGVIAGMPADISAVSQSVSSHESVLETAGDSLEAKINGELAKAASTEKVLSSAVQQSLSSAAVNAAAGSAAALGMVTGVESSEASLNARFLKAQADVTNKMAGVNAVKASLTAQVSKIESSAAAAVVQGNVGNALIDAEVAKVKDLSTMVKNNDQNVVVGISKTLSGSKKTVDRSKVLLAEMVSGDLAEYATPAGISTYDYFTRACALDGTSIACGAYAYNKGAVFVYNIDTATAKSTLVQTIVPRTRYSSAQFGYSVRRSGAYMVVGAPNDYSTTSATGTSSYLWGRGYVYKMVNGKFVEQRFLVPGPLTSSKYRYPYCGRGVAISGTTAVMTCYGYGSSSSGNTDYFAGGVMVFNILTGARLAVLTPVLRQNTRDRYSYMGIDPASVDMIDSKTFAVGSTYYDRRYSSTSSTFYSNTGSTFVYTQASNGAWTTKTLGPAHSTRTSQYCGRSVKTIDAKTIAVGCDNYYSYGAVQIFTRTSTTSTTWTQKQLITHPTRTLYDYFGFNLAVSSDGKRLGIGAYGADDKMSTNGKVFYYTRNSAGTFVADTGANKEFYIEKPARSSNRIGFNDFGFGNGFNWYGVSNSGTNYYMGSLLVTAKAELFPTVK